MKRKNIPSMPKATAVWLVENTSLTFKQIGDFCGMHELEVKGIADGEVANGIMGINPILNGQISREEIKRCEENPKASLNLQKSNIEHLINNKKTSRYTPVARRRDKPDAIFWLLKNYPEVTDTQIVKLIGTTKSTIESIRDRSHWNTKNIKPRDPVLLGLCTQIELNKLLVIIGNKSNKSDEDTNDESN